MRFHIAWRDNAYYVSVPNYEGGDVVTAEVTDGMIERALQAWFEDPMPLSKADRFHIMRMRAALDAAFAEPEDTV